MTDLETRLRGDLAELADAVPVDGPAAWAAIRARAHDPRGVALVPAPPVRPRSPRRWAVAAGAAALLVVVVTVAVLRARVGDDGPSRQPVPGSTGSTVPASSLPTPTSAGAAASSTGSTTSLPTPTSSAGSGVADGAVAMSVGLAGRVAVPATAPTDLGHTLLPAALGWAGESLERRVYVRDDGAWARVEVGLGSDQWDQKAGEVGATVRGIQLGGVEAMTFQEFTTWVVMWRGADDTLTLRSGGLDRAAVEALATELAAGRVPSGWTALAAPVSSSRAGSMDQFNGSTVVWSAELPTGADLRAAALADVPSGSTLEPVTVAGGDGWVAVPPPEAQPITWLTWAQDGMAVTLTHGDATRDELLDLAAGVTIEPLADVTFPVSLQGDGSVQLPLPRDVAIVERVATAAGARYQWLTYRTRPIADPSSAIGYAVWCVSYLEAAFPSALGDVCSSGQETFVGVAQIVAGTAVGVVAADVTAAWFVVDGQRTDATLEPFGAPGDGIQVVRATVPLGERVSLHLVRSSGEELAGAVGSELTLRCSGCRPPVIAPSDWVMPTLTPDGIVLPTTPNEPVTAQSAGDG